MLAIFNTNRQKRRGHVEDKQQDEPIVPDSIEELRPDKDNLSGEFARVSAINGKKQQAQLSKLAQKLLTGIVNYNLLKLQDDIDKLTPVQRANLMTKLMPYVMPTHKSIEMDIQSSREMVWNETRQYQLQEGETVQEVEKKFAWTQNKDNYDEPDSQKEA
jgi:hypothetical protein